LHIGSSIKTTQSCIETAQKCSEIRVADLNGFREKEKRDKLKHERRVREDIDCLAQLL
jgi:hypothetical protein